MSAVGTILFIALRAPLRQVQKRPLDGLKKGQVKLVLLWGFAEYGNRKALRLKAQGVYSCK